MECDDVDKVKPLDRLFDDQMNEFESGKDRVCDKDLDKMMWKLGDYENEEPQMEAEEFEEDRPIEELLIEKKVIFGSHEKPYYMEDDPEQEDILPGDQVVMGRSMHSDTGR